MHRRVDEKIIQVSKGQIPYQLVWFQILVSLFPVLCFNVDVTENNLFREYISGHRSLLLSFPLIKLRDWSYLHCCGTCFHATGLNSRFFLIWMSLVVNLEANLQNAMQWSLTCPGKSLCNRVSMSFQWRNALALIVLSRRRAFLCVTIHYLPLASFEREFGFSLAE